MHSWYIYEFATSDGDMGRGWRTSKERRIYVKETRAVYKYVQQNLWSIIGEVITQPLEKLEWVTRKLYTAVLMPAYTCVQLGIGYLSYPPCIYTSIGRPSTLRIHILSVSTKERNLVAIFDHVILSCCSSKRQVFFSQISLCEVIAVSGLRFTSLNFYYCLRINHRVYPIDHAVFMTPYSLEVFHLII